METPQNATVTTKELLQTTGVSRSGRVRKKSSKLLDFQSPDVMVEKKTKRLPKTARSSGRVRGRFSNTSGGAAVRGGRRGASIAAGSSGGGYLETNSSYAAANDNDDDDVDGNVMAPVGFDSLRLTDPPAASTASAAAADSDFEIDEMVADLVEGVVAENAYNSEPKIRQSLYMSEKTNKRKMIKDGKLMPVKVERKDKGKARYTAYSLWSREFRKTSKFSKNQDLDFSNAARRLGELWANVSNKEKSAWRRKAKIQATKAKVREKTAAYNSSAVNSAATSSTGTNVHAEVAIAGEFLSNRATTSRTKKLAAERTKISPSRTSNSGRKRYNSYKSAVMGTPVEANDHFGSNSKLPNIAAIDAAAHLKLLGESLSIIGERLKEHEGQIAVAGSLSVLLDSLLCSLGPLLCLTTMIPGMEQKTPHLSDNLSATLDNIAYVMPGL